MGPTNVALVKLYRADQLMREAQERLDVATKNVRVQERRTKDAAEKLKTAQAALKDQQVKAGSLDLDLRTRDAHIEKLRNQQQTARNNTEYQTFLIEINTQKVDKAKVEEEAMKVMQQVETSTAEVAELTTILSSEQKKLADFKAQIGDKIVQLEAEISGLKTPRDALAATLPPKARSAFDRMAEHHDGEAMSALLKPDRRKEEYVCSACMLDLVTDVYNKLHTRDDLVFCPSCRRILYIPDDLPPDLAVNKKKVSTATAIPESERPKEAPRARGRVGEILTAAQGESVKNALDAGQNAIEYHVTVDGKVVGIYKGKNAENLERVIRYRFDEAGLKHEVHVNPVVHETPAAAAEVVPAAEPAVKANVAPASVAASPVPSGSASVPVENESTTV